ncbi:putative calcium-transporting ATPase 13, plasma membrane-type [Quercus robur]|uniref:putative calcium-transporting ATPase 13, plasma membrane-type n=1 Tax=Quercus robur TaxID=38942 RepID=UPI002162FD0D|nr:putative calcium-transporting ATPase 13, plasma membrane-type [Quercus robur]
MSTIIQENIECNKSLCHVPNTPSAANKRWRSAFVYIYYNRFKIDQTSLTELVKERNVDKLQNIGGVDGVASMLETNVEFGIHGNDEDITRRRESFGSNSYKRPQRKSLFHFVVKEFKDLTIIISLLSAVPCLAFDMMDNETLAGRDEDESLIAALFLVVISAISNFWQSKQFQKLSELCNNIQIKVVRARLHQKVSISELVVGDVVCLKIGDQVPADGLFLEGHSLKVEEPSITQDESDHVEVNCHHPFLFSGTKVVDGYARMLVTSVGKNTTWGELMSSIIHDTNELQTPLQVRLNKLTSSIRKVGLAIALLALVVLLVRHFTGNIADECVIGKFHGSKKKFCDMVKAMRILATATTIVELVIPKGFSLAVKRTHVYAMKKMMLDQAMVRKLSALETMGFATTICTDIAGSLTLNQMKVTKFWLGKESFDAAAYSSIAPYFLELVQEGVAMNTIGTSYRPSSRFEIEFLSNPTEKAILSWAILELNMEMEQLMHNCKILSVEAFNSHMKRSGVLLRRMGDSTIHVHWKGAAEIILKMCSRYNDSSGIMKELDDHERMKFEQIIQGMEASSLQCVAFAHKQLSKEDQEYDTKNKKIEEEGLTLLGLVGLKDPCCLGVRNAVEDCQYAGVNIKMITGDNVFIARAIATECGILRPGQDMVNGVVIEGMEFRNYTPEERMEKVDKICVMAKASPTDKSLMVECLKQKGHIVAVIGGGINDAPALKEADIGLSMGIHGTKVVKLSSDIVILDDNFASMAKVLRWGRCVHKNIQKFIQFQLTVNVTAIIVNFVAFIFVNEGPLTGVQLLWVNLITHNLVALALAIEQPTKTLMEKLPVGWTMPLITNNMWRNLLAQALYQTVVILTLELKGRLIFNVCEKVKDTLIFNTFVLCQVFNQLNARKLMEKNIFKGIHRNNLFFSIIATTIVLQVVMVEYLKWIEDTKGLNWWEWAACIGMAIVSWLVGWIVKRIPVPQKPFLSYLKN